MGLLGLRLGVGSAFLGESAGPEISLPEAPPLGDLDIAEMREARYPFA
jgi:DNA-directed RNA polymerase